MSKRRIAVVGPDHFALEIPKGWHRKQKGFQVEQQDQLANISTKKWEHPDEYEIGILVDDCYAVIEINS